MRLTSLAIVLSLLLTVMGLAATATKHKAPAKKAAVVKKAASVKKPVSKSSSKKKVVRRRPRTTWRNRQLSPTQDRYKEIQQALVEKGYLKSEPSGVWDKDSQQAMTQFQTDQKLPANGKITAAALIGLGLGAKSAGAPEAPPLPGAPGAQPAAP
jgi:peptidoglycan hydrolase-like protein with peptidoglycan-binding domain